MAGTPQNKEKLNRTLEKVCNILHTEGIKDWCIMYGTLLGIVRENGCIAGDDDIDIIINCEYSVLKALFKGYDFRFYRNGWGRRFRRTKHILKTKPTDSFSSVDFYIADVNQEGIFDVRWMKNKISNCYVDLNKKTFVEKSWRSTILHLPNDYEDKLVSMYGDEWKIPKSGSCRMNFDF
jgi:hypothetical protein